VTYTIHMSVSVRGMLKLPKAKRRIFTDDNGKTVSSEEATEHLLTMLSEGHEVLPMGEPCNNWNIKTGCGGHNKDGTPRTQEVQS